ncbi:MAG TPA: hypothetical protein PLC98_24785 [Anaerolineales bacterium]|nr:hypothetical protein [Anaerolineales bacterium]
MGTVTRSHFILYVTEQEVSRAFFETVLAQAPTLHVPGMTEFAIAESVVVGLMPETGIMRLLNLGAPQMPGTGLVRGELYLVVDNPDAYHARALSAGAKELSPMAERDWGDTVGYSLEPNGYVLAFARPSEQG